MQTGNSLCPLTRSGRNVITTMQNRGWEFKHQHLYCFRVFVALCSDSSTSHVISRVFLETEGLSLCSQHLVTYFPSSLIQSSFLPSCCFKIHLNIILLSTPRTSGLSLSFMFPLCISLLRYARYISLFHSSILTKSRIANHKIVRKHWSCLHTCDFLFL
jgi:hypothetical protein